jgi:hypothetical protein
MNNKKNPKEKDALAMRDAKAKDDKQRGAPSSSRKHTEKHERDDSSGAEKNTTKKQQNSV